MTQWTVRRWFVPDPGGLRAGFCDLQQERCGTAKLSGSCDLLNRWPSEARPRIVPLRLAFANWPNSCLETSEGEYGPTCVSERAGCRLRLGFVVDCNDGGRREDSLSAEPVQVGSD